MPANSSLRAAHPTKWITETAKQKAINIAKSSISITLPVFE